MKRLLSESNGVQQHLHTDNTDGSRGAIELSQDVEGVLELVRKRREQPVSKEFRPMAEIPMAVYLEACVNGHANDPEYWRRWANNPDNAAFRIQGGKV